VLLAAIIEQAKILFWFWVFGCQPWL